MQLAIVEDLDVAALAGQTVVIRGFRSVVQVATHVGRDKRWGIAFDVLHNGRADCFGVEYGETITLED